ncbi:MAG: helix-turn-helix transcriptional regulator [Bacillota bacterium]|jgi:predicted DNA-binding transcriptional regulator YafY
MAKLSKQKLKLIYLMKILFEKTDENHPMTVAQMIEELSLYDISAERKSIYDDLEALRIYGLDIECIKSKTTGYYVANRDFELPELKLIVDSVQVSKFITVKKSMKLIKKLERFCSIHDANTLQRQVYIVNRNKTVNECIYYNVDKIHNAISEDRKISFQYFEYDINKEKKYKRNGERYVISAYALNWDDEYYYLIGYDEDANSVKHFRVDKMFDIEVLEEKRDRQDSFIDPDPAKYSQKVFAMFTGTPQKVKIEFVNHLIGVVLDRFGHDIFIIKSDNEHFTINVDVAISPKFYAWLFSFRNDARLLEPDHIVEEMKNHLEMVREIYT